MELMQDTFAMTLQYTQLCLILKTATRFPGSLLCFIDFAYYS